MARREPMTIVVGGRSFAIRPLTLDQVQALEDAIAAAGTPIRQAAAILAIGLSRDHSGIDLAALECDTDDLRDATTAILRQGGFMPPGEAPAAAANATTGAPSAVA